jgi:hypothetical protein
MTPKMLTVLLSIRKIPYGGVHDGGFVGSAWQMLREHLDCVSSYPSQLMYAHSSVRP